MSNTTCGICERNHPAEYEVMSTKHWRIRHSLETNILGYCILEPQRHFLDLSEATDDELQHYPILLSALMKTLREIPECLRIYTFSLAEAVPHYHLHVIPRSENFPRGFAGRGIMSYPTSPAADKSLVESRVQSLRQRIKLHLPEIDKNRCILF